MRCHVTDVLPRLLGVSRTGLPIETFKRLRCGGVFGRLRAKKGNNYVSVFHAPKGLQHCSEGLLALNS